MMPLADWRATGDAFAKQPVKAESAYVRKQYVGHEGAFYIGTYERDQGDGPQGTLRSPDFELEKGLLTFLIAGGTDPEKLTVSLHDVTDGSQLHAATGLRSNAMRRVAWDVTSRAGTRAYILIRDLASGSWGHVNADDFRFVAR